MISRRVSKAMNVLEKALTKYHSNLEETFRCSWVFQHAERISQLGIRKIKARSNPNSIGFRKR